ncbi:MAG: hypothetical protein H6Q38_2841 [Chloroflexi bacterium]|nr:hypothetical protein [Chloroflexota bacterium]
MDTLFITHILNALLMIGLPLLLAIFLKRRYKHSWVLFFSGVVGFIVSQVGHIPFNYLLTLLFQRNVLPAPPQEYQLIFNAIVLGLSAGLWEELVRYGTLRWWIGKNVRTWSQALFFGNGWGGIEAIILGGLALLAFFQLLAMRNIDLSGLIPAAQLELVRQQIESYWTMPWYNSLMGAYERAWTLIIQISFTVLVLQAFTRGKIIWVWLAVAWHALIDALAVYIAGTSGFEAAEVAVTIAGLISLGFIFALRQPEAIEAPSQPLEPLPVQDASILAAQPEPAIIADKLDDTRYN